MSESATVRHVDQLTEEALDALVGMRDGGNARPAGVDAGEVVVSTSYLEVVRADRPPGADGGEASERSVDVGPVD